MAVNKPPPKTGGGGSPTSAAPAVKKLPNDPGIVVGPGGTNLSKSGAKSAPAEPMPGKKPKLEPTEKIEEGVLALLSKTLGEAAPPQLFEDFGEKILPRLSRLETSHEILKAFSNIDVTADKVAQSLRGNPYYEHLFLRVIASMSKREEKPSLDGAVVMLGMQNSRNLILALQMSRAVRGGHPEWDQSGKLKLVPKDVLKYALRTEELLVAAKAQYADTGYAAGLVFDFLTQLSGAISEDPKKANAYIEQVYTHSLRAAQIGAELALHLPEFSFSKYAFSACLLHDVGKIAMAILAPDYLKFVEDVDKKKPPRALRNFAEQTRFGMTHAILGQELCHAFRIFRPIERAVLFHHEPYLLKDSNRGLYQLASLIALATSMASNPKRIDQADDPIVQEWKGPELQDFKVDPKSIVAASAKGA
jgi:HD-like signal output (HDOD) protein